MGFCRKNEFLATVSVMAYTESSTKPQTNERGNPVELELLCESGRVLSSPEETATPATLIPFPVV
ncbi:hypothetical protein EYF80_015008 [Liparis tanakae]|uniref:Uncharacterized protein n=1 Tax=Liparis tanakae TaxID=230148 RepID=A0A4Z2I9Z0_9TELE|nr:hypothetical protein EYF80_015008 [Liparis tanakae]